MTGHRPVRVEPRLDRGGDGRGQVPLTPADGAVDGRGYHLGRALRLARATGDRTAELDAVVGLGRIHLTQGRYEQATEPTTESPTHHTLHEDERARAHWQHALEILTRLGTDHTTDEETNVAAIRAHLDGRYDSPQ